MTKISQFIVVLLDCCIVGLLLYVLWIAMAVSFQQLYIRIRCGYRGFKEKPGRACVICKYQGECGRAWESEEYRQYILRRVSHPDQARGMLDEIRAEEESKPK